MPLRLYAVLTLEASQKSSEEFQIYISYSSETFKKLKRKRISCAAWIQFAIKTSTLYVGTSLDSEADRRPHHLLHQYFQNPLVEARVALETMGPRSFHTKGRCF